jgi:hypothetical protein
MTSATQINHLAAQIGNVASLESGMARVRQAEHQIQAESTRLSNEVKALRAAYPDTMAAKFDYQIHELQQRIVRYQNEPRCDPDLMLRDYNRDAGAMVEARLDIENLLRPLAYLEIDLSRLEPGRASSDLSSDSRPPEPGPPTDAKRNRCDRNMQRARADQALPTAAVRG